MRYAESLPNESRVPCLVFIDEAAHWFPQTSTMSYLLPLTQQALTRAVFEVVTTGRKRGIIPAFFTQRPADFDKRLAAQADLLILMRQRQDVDLARYKEYLGEQARTAATFGRGEAVLILPDGEKLHTTFYPRQSRHVSHTPTAETAYQRFAPSPLFRVQVPGTGPGARSERRYTFHPAVPGTTATGGNAPSSTAEQDGTEGTDGNLFPVQEQPVPGTSSQPHHRFTREQEAEFVRQYQRLGSIKAAITAMHVSYGRYQWHASQIIRARTGRKA